MVLAIGGQGRRSKDVENAGISFGWLVVVAVLLLAANLSAGEPVKDGKLQGDVVKKNEPVKDEQSVVSDETKLAIPDDKEMDNLVARLKRGKLKGGKDYDDAVVTFHRAIDTLGEGAETWSDADYKARLKAALPYIATIKEWFGTAPVIHNWYRYAANAKKPELLVQRIRNIKVDCADNWFRPSPGDVGKAVLFYLDNNNEKMPTLEKKRAFVMWLKTQGVEGPVLSNVLKELGK